MMLKNTFLMLPKESVAVGDRIIVRSHRQAMAVFVGQPGTVTEVFATPRGSCLIRIDGAHTRSDQFLYGDEVAVDTSW